MLILMVFALAAPFSAPSTRPNSTRQPKKNPAPRPSTWTPRATPSVGLQMGTDTLGRDTYSRVVYGTQVSLVVGFTVAIFSILIGTAVGLIRLYPLA